MSRTVLHMIMTAGPHQPQNPILIIQAPMLHILMGPAKVTAEFWCAQA